MVGQTFSHYRILERLGAGGMGVVYKAEDTRLGRLVAVKFLPEELARDTAALDRFQREARAASALNHPNICTLHDIGEQDGRPFLVMEYLEGQTLRERMGGRGLKLDDLFELSIQLAGALEAAHARGIIHRDIKPSNIFLNKEGQAKILDFGLAKLATEKAGKAALHSSGVVTVAISDLTSPGSTLGTVAYMSPEQARGEELDARTDLFSFGVVLYEMATGVSPFQGGTTAVMFDAILNKTPAPPSQLRPELPQQFDQIVHTALEKDRDVRYQAASELKAALKRLRRDTDSASAIGLSTARVAAARPRSKAWIAAAAAAVLLLATAFVLYRWLLPAKAPPFQRIQLSRLTTSGRASSAAISPDGRYVVHVMDEDGLNSLWMRQVSTGSNVQVAPPTKESYIGLTFSPDGEYLYFVKVQPGGIISTLYQMPVLGGTPKKLIDDADSPVTFSPDGHRIAFLRGILETQESTIVVANADGTGERVLAARKAPHYFVSSLAWSPDGKLIAAGAGTADVSGYSQYFVLVPVDGGPERPLAGQKWLDVDNVAWLESGRGLVITLAEQANSGKQIYYVSYPAGEVRRITNDLNNYIGASVTRDGRALVTVQADQVSNLWVAQIGEAEAPRQITHGSGRQDGLGGLAWTPDGRLVFASLASGSLAAWVMNADGSGAREISSGGRLTILPQVTADGRYLLLVSDRGTGTPHIWRCDADGGNPVQLTKGQAETAPEPTPDGKWVLYTSLSGMVPTLWKVPMEGGEPVRLTATKGISPVVSPDGKQVAFIYIDEQRQPMRGVAIVPIEGGQPTQYLDITSPRVHWTADGKGLLYFKSDRGVWNIWTQPVAGGEPKQLIQFTADRIFAFDVSADGKRLALARGVVNIDVVLIRDAE